jgi:hypothetical protein
MLFHVTEAKFHMLVERRPLRETSMAWERVNLEAIPTEFQAWVGLDISHDSSSTSTTSKLEPATASSTN